jgi:hypothetical protein
MVTKRLMFALASFAVAAATSGCFSHYSDGPEFRAATPRGGLSIVYVYRPASGWGAATFIDAAVYGRSVSLCSNSYAAFVVPPGPLTADIRIPAFVSSVLVNGVGVTGAVTTAEASNVRTPVPIAVAPGQSYFVRVKFASRGEPPSAVLVNPQEGLDDIEDIHLIPGGRARWPVYQPPAAPPPPSALSAR